jgi:uncharacterized protein (TIGR03083 family)
MTPRTWFTTAAAGFLQVVEGITTEQLDRPGLGEWDVRSLLGHAARAFLTLESYLALDPGDITLEAPSEYFIATRAGLADPVAVTQRGRDAGAALGEDPGAAVREIARRVLETVAGTPDDAVVTTPVGGTALRNYLPTRAFELTVHGMDLATATAQPIPAGLGEAAVPALELAAQIATPAQRADLLFAATGRNALDAGFSVL